MLLACRAEFERAGRVAWRPLSMRCSATCLCPPKYEQIIEIFRSNSEKDVSIEELTPLFTGNANPTHAALTKISKLNEKLEPFNLRAVRVQEAYRIISLNRVY